MKIFASPAAARADALGGTVATLGVFDGVHRGHQALLTDLVRCGAERDLVPVVVTFTAHPRGLLTGRPPKAITALETRLRLFEECGVRAVLQLDFDEALRAMEPEDFAREIFAESLCAKVVLLGYNNRFGRGGRGDLALLEAIGKGLGFEAQRSAEFREGGAAISSSAIRHAIESADFAAAEAMLGRPFALTGRVVEGNRIGRTIGFPTANLAPDHDLRPPQGVYGVRVFGAGVPLLGLMNIGTRPTLRKLPLELPILEERLEVHLLDYEGDLYGAALSVEFLTRIRAERRFEGLADLQAQIAADVASFRSAQRISKEDRAGG